MKTNQKGNELMFKFKEGELTQESLKQKVNGLKLLFGDDIKICIEGESFFSHLYNDEFYTYRHLFEIKKVNAKWIDIEPMEVDGDIHTKIGISPHSYKYIIWVDSPMAC